MDRTATSSIADAARFEDARARSAREGKTFGARLLRIAGEPFVHFTLLGALVFAGHRLVARALEVPVIEVSTAKQRELAKLFEQRQRRAPDAAEIQHLVQRHVEDEVLFREGLRLSLVTTDPMLRAQVIARVRGMIQAELDEKPPVEADLERYYQAHQTDYALPENGGYPPLSSIRAQVVADYRKDRTSRAFQTEVARLTSEWRVHVAEQP
jgi:hypothetical protein